MPRVLIPGPRSVKLVYPNGTLSEVVSNQDYLIRRDDSVKAGSPLHPITRWRNPAPYERHIEDGTGLHIALISERRLKSTNSLESTCFVAGPDSNGGYVFPTLPNFPSWVAERAINRALSNLNSKNINLAVAFGERKQTASFVTEVITDAGRMVSAVRRKDLRAIKNQLLGRRRKQKYYRSTIHEVLAAPSRLWLKNAYALKPFAADVFGACEDLNESELEKPEVFGVTAKGKVKERIRERQDFYLTFNSGYHPYLRSIDGFHGSMVRLDYFIVNPFTRTLAELGITNPLALAWELLPLSFVADWFVPVGPYLDLQDADTGLKFRKGSNSRITKSTVQFSNSKEKSYDGSSSRYQKVLLWEPRGKFRNARLTRQVLHSSPSPYFTLPRNMFSFPRLTTAIALVITLTS